MPGETHAAWRPPPPGERPAVGGASPHPLAELILDTAAERGESLAQIAARGGLPRPTIYWLASKTTTQTPRQATLERLAVGLCVPLERVVEASVMTTYGTRVPPGYRAHVVDVDGHEGVVLLPAETGKLSDDDLAELAGTLRGMLERRRARLGVARKTH